jgi:hypothetical protein
MEGVLVQPLFTADHSLLLPEGTQVDGKITLARSARMFHRGGKPRFALDTVQVPPMPTLPGGAPQIAPTPTIQPTRAQLQAVEADPKAVKVDQEGTAKATESKTRLLRPAIAGLVAAKSMDNDTGKQTASGGGGGNAGGQALDGFSGFGLLGLAVTKGPSQLGSAMGFYGLAWSAYSSLVPRGREINFEKNSTVAIRFGTSPKSRKH